MLELLTLELGAELEAVVSGVKRELVEVLWRELVVFTRLNMGSDWT
jgi:hypothetical protein